MARLLLKSLTALSFQEVDYCGYGFKIYRSIVTRAQQLNQELIEKHDYKKGEVYVDILEEKILGDTLSIIDFNRLMNKYVMDEEADERFKFLFRSISYARLDALDGKEAQRRLLMKIGEQLDDGKYKNVKRGEVIYFEFCMKKVIYF